MIGSAIDFLFFKGGRTYVHVRVYVYAHAHVHAHVHVHVYVYIYGANKSQCLPQDDNKHV
jgi:hypothetical protein